MRFFCFLLVFFFSWYEPVNADTYQWTDAQGVVSFTDNPENVPKKYRSKVKITPSADTAQETSTADKSKSSAESGKQTETTAVTPGHTQGPKLYGGHDEGWWKSRYASLRSELKGLQDNLPPKREDLEKLRRKLTIYTYSRNRIAYQEKLAEIQRDEDRIKALTDQLASLDTEAAVAGVPFDWRQ